MSRRKKKSEIVVRLAFPAARPIQLRYYCPVRKQNVRESTGSHDAREAEAMRKKREAELIAGTYEFQHERTWQYFRDEYRSLVVSQMRSANRVEPVLDVVQRILKPHLLTDIATTEALTRLQAELLAGKESKQKKRSPHTVQSYMATVMSALSWAKSMGWIKSVPERPRLKLSKLDPMKGRPLTGEEFERILLAVDRTVGADAAPSWKYLLRGLWASALRIDEALEMSWDDPNGIQPLWGRHDWPILAIPAHLQKNDKDQEIPLLPWLEDVLLETPPENRTGRVFRPLRRRGVLALDPDWVGRVISDIGRAANVKVKDANDRTGKRMKYASAHDLRRSCCQRLLNAGVDPLIVQRVMRHSSLTIMLNFYSKAQTQQDAAHIRSKLGTGQGTSTESENARDAVKHSER